MTKPELRRLLDDVHARLKEAQSLSEDEREALRALLADIQAVLEQTEGSRPLRDSSVLKRLNHAIQQFEISHPYLTLALSELMNTLSRAGV
jgi:HPt (histidine-containing phosphotransfer) domain-containing protein